MQNSIQRIELDKSTVTAQKKTSAKKNNTKQQNWSRRKETAAAEQSKQDANMYECALLSE